MRMKNQGALSSSTRRFIFIISSEKAKTKIDIFRKKWKIDTGGFKNKNTYYQWLEKTVAKPPIKFERIILTNKVTGYSFTGGQIYKGKTCKELYITKRNAKPIRCFNDNFRKAVDELGVEIKMDNNWSRLFTDYIFWGKKALINKGDASLDILKITEFYEEGRPIREKLIMTIEPNTTKNEVISAWEKFIEKEKKSMKGFINLPPNKKVDILR